MTPMQEQEGSKDSGPFSIAVMTSLAYEDDPSEITYKQLDLKQHLIHCFANGELVLLSKGIMHTHAGVLYTYFKLILLCMTLSSYIYNYV